MLYSVLIYDSEALVDRLTPEEHGSRLERHVALQDSLRREGDLGPVARLMPTSAAVTLKPPSGPTAEPLVMDGPFAETKEHLVGFYVMECDSLEEAVERAGRLPLESGALEVRPIAWFEPGNQP